MRGGVWMLVIAGCGFTRGVAANDAATGSDATSPSDAQRDVGTTIDTPLDAVGYCLGDSTITVCLAAMPTAPKDYSAMTAIDTGVSSPDCATNVVSANATSVCVIAAGEISILNLVTASGSRPLVLMSSSTITLNNTIDVASHIGGTPQAKGPGADPTCPGAVAPTGGVGGFGGSFATSGGSGGGDNNGGTGGTPPTTDPNPMALRGGCAGGDGANGGGAGGHGGGAIALLAATHIILNNTIDASGAGGRGAQNVTSGGGGGGAGGMIVLDAPLITAGGPSIFANGGGGGEGEAGNKGQDGSDAPDPSTAASGGSGGGTGGDGGNGSVGAGSGSNGSLGKDSGNGPGGGGGGGGGGGVIQIFKGTGVPGTFSPPPSYR